MPTQPGHPSVDRRNEYWRLLHTLQLLLGGNGEFRVAVDTKLGAPEILVTVVLSRTVSAICGNFG